MNGETETIAGIPAAAVHAALDKREAIKAANATPLPGALKDAFAVAPNIQVNKFSVRPFYDGDFDILVSLGNPLGEIMMTTINGTGDKPNYVPRGQVGWEICYLFTNPIEQCFEEVENGSFKKNARSAFCKFRLPALGEIHQAVMQQLAIYWSTGINYEEVEDQEEGTVKKK